MTAAFFIVILAGWVLFSGWRFYKMVNWSEPPGITPDLAEIRKKQAELEYLQDRFHEAHEQGRISAACISEIDRFCAQELEALQASAQPNKS